MTLLEDTIPLPFPLGERIAKCDMSACVCTTLESAININSSIFSVTNAV